MELVDVPDVARTFAAGDTPADILAAHHAGVRAIGVLSGIGTREQLAQSGAAQIVGTVPDLAVSDLFIEA